MLMNTHSQTANTGIPVLCMIFVQTLLYGNTPSRESAKIVLAADCIVLMFPNFRIISAQTVKKIAPALPKTL